MMCFARVSLLVAALASTQSVAYDPLVVARKSVGQVKNQEAVIPVQCYTKTDGVSNPCWTCHTDRNGLNEMEDWELQVEYAFSDVGKTNHWSNLFKDRRQEMAGISDAAALNYIRQDNYTPLRRALSKQADYRGWRPDLDLMLGFDSEGFARDGSWWRAFRYKPFLGTFWPTNGSTDDVMIRLPWEFYTDAAGKPSKSLYKINLAILELAMTVDDKVPDALMSRAVEPLDEHAAGIDLDGDGKIATARVSRVVGLPKTYAGKAAVHPVLRYVYPPGAEFLHTVRYVDPDRPDLLSRRLKEVRYSVKSVMVEKAAISRAYTQEKDHKDQGVLPYFIGKPDSGLLSDFRWQLQGFIEDEKGRLRLQTTEEHYYCMGCHGTIGVTVDQTFGYPRKVPGAAGWGHQTLVGIHDVPQIGHREPEILTYFKRVGGGDEFRANEEILKKFFPGGKLDEPQVRRASTRGDRDITWLLKPSRQRAMLLNKAYITIVQEQRFDLGRDVVLAPATRVHKHIENAATGFDADSGIYKDGRLWLDWDN